MPTYIIVSLFTISLVSTIPHGTLDSQHSFVSGLSFQSSSIALTNKPYQDSPVLYVDCLSIVDIDIPVTDPNVKPIYKTDGAKIVLTETPGRVMMIPHARTFTVQVYIGTKLHSEITYQARAVPLPRCTVNSGINEVFVKAGVKMSEIKYLHVAAKAEAEFMAAMPKEAKFRITKAEITVSRGTLAIEIIQVNKTTDLSALAKIVQPGDKLVFHFQEVERLSYTQEKFLIPLTNNFTMIEVHN